MKKTKEPYHKAFLTEELEKDIQIKRHERFCQRVSHYMKNFEMFIPCDCLTYEWAFIRRTVRTLSPLTKPFQLAKYLEIDTILVYDALEDGFLPHFTDGHICYIKTACILMFLRKYCLL